MYSSVSPASARDVATVGLAASHTLYAASPIIVRCTFRARPISCRSLGTATGTLTRGYSSRSGRLAYIPARKKPVANHAASRVSPPLSNVAALAVAPASVDRKKMIRGDRFLAATPRGIVKSANCGPATHCRRNICPGDNPKARNPRRTSAMRQDYQSIVRSTTTLSGSVEQGPTRPLQEVSYACQAAALVARGLTVASALVNTTPAKTSTDRKATIELIARSGSMAVNPIYIA